MLVLHFTQKGVVKRFSECLQFNMNSTILTTTFFQEMPQYVVICMIFLVFVIVIAFFLSINHVFFTIKYWLKRKYDSIDKYIENNSPDDNPPNVYKDMKKQYKKGVSNLGVNTLPNGKKIVKIVGKVIEFKKKK